jgi:hypothetical protein
MNIDWGTVSLTTAINLALGVIIFSFWKPWAKSYSVEKAKNFARKEDLDVIVAEVRAVEKARKEMENTIWGQQTRWNHRKDVYAELLTALNKLVTASSDCIAVIEKNNNTHPLDDVKSVIEEELHSKVMAYRQSQALFLEALSMVQLLGSRQCNDELERALTLNPYEAGHVNWAREEVRIHIAGRNALIPFARIDLGTDVTDKT